MKPQWTWGGVLKGQQYRSILPVLLLEVIAPPAWAAPPSAGSDQEIVVVASRTGAEPRGQTILLASDIEQSQGSTVLEALDQVAGVRAVQTGGIAGSSFLSLRGGEPNFTLIEIDGWQVNDPSNREGGGFDFAQLAPGALASVTVMQGGLSAIHGSDSLSGLVSLRTRDVDVESRDVEAKLRGQSGRAFAGALAAAYGWENGGVLLAGDWLDSGHATPGSEIERRQLLVSSSQRAGPLKIKFTGLHATTDRSLYPQDSGGPLFAASDELEDRRTRFDLAGVTATLASSAPVVPRVRLGWSRHKEFRASPAIAPAVLNGVPATVDDTRFTRLEAGADLTARLAHNLTVAAGTEFVRESVVGDGLIDVGVILPSDFRLRRTIAAGFLEATWFPVPRLSLTGAVRRDDPSTSASTTTTRISGSFEVGQSGLVLFGSWATGFKLPSLFALGYPLIANPTLRPERSVNAELGVLYPIPDGNIRVTAYSNRFRDLIDFDPLLFTNVNRSRVRASGVDVDLDWSPVKAVRVAATLSHLRLKSEAPLRGRPAWQGSATLTWRPSNRFSAFASAGFDGNYLDSSIPTGLIRQSGRVRIDFGGEIAVASRVRIAAVVRNALGAKYQEAVGFLARRRDFRISSSYAF